MCWSHSMLTIHKHHQKEKKHHYVISLLEKVPTKSCRETTQENTRDNNHQVQYNENNTRKAPINGHLLYV